MVRGLAGATGRAAARYMEFEAYLALDAIKRGDNAALEKHRRWLDAFKAIRWIVYTDNGPALTEAGRHACADFATRRRRQ